ncbi:MAG: redoxin domain-containing protein [Candidatus Aminicenantes bacterium]|nr:redoxin domain-containing protein [Candidatus Aminicenantes bacterium]
MGGKKFFSRLPLCVLFAAVLYGENPPVKLGPKDGDKLPATDILRVSVGSIAPDFCLETRGGNIVTLSDFRGKKNVILSFYTGVG